MVNNVWKLNLGAVEIEIDAKTTFGWIIEEYSSSLHHASLSLDCNILLSQIPQVKMSHYFHEANKCADTLTKKCPALDQDIMYLIVLLVNLCLLLFYNNVGLYYERRSPLNSIVVDSSP